MTVKPQPGDFGLVASIQGPWYDRLFAQVIDDVTESQVHHAFLYIGEGDPRGNIIEAVKRVSYGWADQYDDIVWSTGRLPVELTPTDEQRLAIIEAAKALVGTPYNVLDLLAIGLAQKRMGQVVTGREWWVKRLSDDGRLICSQAIDVEYLKAGIHLFDDGRLSGLVSPGDLDGLLLPTATP